MKTEYKRQGKAWIFNLIESFQFHYRKRRGTGSWWASDYQIQSFILILNDFFFRKSDKDVDEQTWVKNNELILLSFHFLSFIEHKKIEKCKKKSFNIITSLKLIPNYSTQSDIAPPHSQFPTKVERRKEWP